MSRLEDFRAELARLEAEEADERSMIDSRIAAKIENFRKKAGKQQLSASELKFLIAHEGDVRDALMPLVDAVMLPFATRFADPVTDPIIASLGPAAPITGNGKHATPANRSPQTVTTGDLIVKLKDAEATIARLEAENEKLDRESYQHSQSVERLKANRVELKKIIEHHEGMIIKQTARVSELGDTFKRQYDELHAKWKAAEATIAALRAENAHLRADWSTPITSKVNASATLAGYTVADIMALKAENAMLRERLGLGNGGGQ